MRHYPFKLVNVFAQSHFEGNPLAVFPQADGITDAEMQQIARQFNLSETVFAFSPNSSSDSQQSAVANLRIFTPDSELPLAGHPTLGCAYVLKQQQKLTNQFCLNTQAKPIGIYVEQNHIEMAITGFSIKPSLISQSQLADCLGVKQKDIVTTAYWLNSGSSQLLLELTNMQAIEQIKLNETQFIQFCHQEEQSAVIYLWYQQDKQIYARCFYEENGRMLEDSGTGSAAANLGAYFISQGKFPAQYHIAQGLQMGRPNRLSLKVDSQQIIYVGGNVIEVGEGVFNLP